MFFIAHAVFHHYHWSTTDHSLLPCLVLWSFIPGLQPLFINGTLQLGIIIYYIVRYDRIHKMVVASDQGSLVLERLDLAEQVHVDFQMNIFDNAGSSPRCCTC